MIGRMGARMKRRRSPLMMLILALVLGAFVAGRAMKTGPSAGQDGIETYEDARPLFWQRIYPEGGRTLYCDQAFGAGYNRGLNIEHVFPMAWVTNALKCGTRKQCRETSARFNQIEADLHNLYPARTGINDARGAMRYGEIPGERRRFGGCDFEVDKGGRVVEPRPGARGEIARAMFYMRDAYELVIFDRLGRLLKQWHRQDPVGAHERQRSDAIEQIQGTRNKYIDNPELVDEIEF